MPYFSLAARVQPHEVKWQLMVASCYRRIGNYQQVSMASLLSPSICSLQQLLLLVQQQHSAVLQELAGGWQALAEHAPVVCCQAN